MSGGQYIMPDPVPDSPPTMLEAHPVKAFSDNYIWLLEAGSGLAVVVDPGDAEPVLAALHARGLRLAGILVTHHHPDHVGGVAALLHACGSVPVFGPRESRADCISRPLGHGEQLTVLGFAAEVIAVPGHTLDHIAYFFAATGAAEPYLFCGDTLFAGGCGRLFEGTAPMMHASLSRLAALPRETRVFCAHEYTLSNLRFAREVEPANAELARRQREAELLRGRDEPTVPSTLALELATNPFLRCADAAVRQVAERHAARELAADQEVFAVIRSWKDNFR